MKHELRQVRAFLKVAQLESFTRAAAELHISQSALTVQIKQLEEELGVLLFDRNKRGVTITAAGRDLHGPLERLLFDAETIVDYAHDISAVKTGLVTVAALPTIAADLLPRTIEEHRRLHPGIRIAVQDVVADRVRELVLKRAVDLGVGTAAKRDREIAAKPLFHDFLAAFVPVTHPLNILQEANYMPTALAMVRSGLGITILPESAADWSRGDLVRIPIQKPALSRQICSLLR